MPDFRPLKPGDRISAISAAAYNAGIRGGIEYLQRSHPANSPGYAEASQECIIKVRNDSGAAVDRFGVLGLGNPVVTPTDSLGEFQRQIVLIGTTPTAASHTGKFAIMREPVPSGAIGEAFVAGACIVQINVTDATHALADVADGDAAKLASGTSGAAKILWKESGTGTKWAVVFFGASVADPAVTVKITGTASGGGKYNGRVLTGTSTAIATGNLGMPEGRTLPGSDNALVLNAKERDTAKHSLSNGYYTGVAVGSTAGGLIIVEISADPSCLFPVTVSKTSGSDGTSSSIATWLYTVTSLAGETLGTSVAQTRPRQTGKQTPGTVGLAYYDNSNTLKLWDAGEVQPTGACT